MADRITNTANNFKTTLSADMGSTDLTATVVTTTGAPSSPCLLVIDANDPAKREVVYFDGTFTGTTFVTTAIGNRYLQGSAAASGIAHTTGAEVTQTALAQHVTDLNDRINADATAFTSHTAGTDAHHAKLHQVDHQAGGADALAGDLNAVSRLRVRSAGVLIATRRAINFLAGTGITLGVGDDAANEEAEVTITGHAQLHQAAHQSGGGDALAGNVDANARVSVRANSTGSVYARRRLNFLNGTATSVTYSDDPGNEEVDVTVGVTQASIDHGSIGGLGDDDHGHYLTTARHDASHPDLYATGTGGDMTLTTTPTDIPGVTYTFTTLRANATAIVTVDLDINVEVAGGGFALVRIQLDGVTQGPEITLGAGTVYLIPVSRTVSSLMATAASHTIKAQAYMQSAGGTCKIAPTRASVTISVTEGP